MTNVFLIHSRQRNMVGRTLEDITLRMVTVTKFSCPLRYAMHYGALRAFGLIENCGLGRYVCTYLPAGVDGAVVGE